MKAEKDEQRKKLSEIKNELKSAGKLTVAKTLKVYELFRSFIVGKARTKLDKIVHKMHSKDPWIGMNGQSTKASRCNHGCLFRTALSSTSSPSSLLSPLRSSVSTCRRQSRNPSKSQFVSTYLT